MYPLNCIKIGTAIDPACGSGGKFVSSADFIEGYGTSANTAMTFFGQEKVDYNAKLCQNAGCLHFGLPSVNKEKEIGNANCLWISYFHSYLNESDRAVFVMASSATDSQGKDKDISEALVKIADIDVMISVGNNFFYTESLPCSLWFFDKGKSEEISVIRCCLLTHEIITPLLTELSMSGANGKLKILMRLSGCIVEK